MTNSFCDIFDQIFADFFGCTEKPQNILLVLFLCVVEDYWQRKPVSASSTTRNAGQGKAKNKRD